ncbi:MAG: hypothetical protein IKC35_04150 [Clostridia bacterium]|nr:hypothetical protein [Clostridia bacterium]
MPGQHDGHRARLRQAADLDPDLTTFSEYQTLEYLLSFVIPRKDTNSIAHNLIKEFGSLNGVLHASRQELFDVPNMTNNAAAFLSSFYSFVRKSELSKCKTKPVIANVLQAVEVIMPYFYERNGELAYLAAMDINDKVLQIVQISEGLSDYTTIDTNKIVSVVTRTKAKKVILAHNHPSGSLRPSKQDVETTSMLFYVLQSIHTVLSDHLIFTDAGFFSFYNNGLMDSLFINSGKMYGLDTTENLKSCRAEGVYVYEPKMLENEK